MKIVLLQTDIQWLKPDENRKHAEQLIRSSTDAQIIILPEMFTTGFCTAPQGVAEKADTQTLAWMQKMAKMKDAAIAGSVLTDDGGKYYNRMYFVLPDGNYTTYNKRHLFSFAGEDKNFEAGQERIIVEYKGVRILLQICYDLRFPVFSRNRGDYDMIIYIASWPTSRIEAWNALLKARAIENLCYVAGVNRAGTDPENSYCGATALYDFMGKKVVSAQQDIEDYIYGNIDIDALNNFRNKFPALQDADKFSIE